MSMTCDLHQNSLLFLMKGSINNIISGFRDRGLGRCRSHTPSIVRMVTIITWHRQDKALWVEDMKGDLRQSNALTMLLAHEVYHFLTETRGNEHSTNASLHVAEINRVCKVSWRIVSKRDGDLNARQVRKPVLQEPDTS